MVAAENFVKPSWDSRVWRMMAHRGVASMLAISLVLGAVGLGSITYMILTGLTPLSPSRGLMIALLVANLSFVLILAALIVWRIARLILARAMGSAGAKLHSRLVTMFSVVAVMPAIIVAIFAAVTLNRGLDALFSERTRVIIGNAERVAEAYLAEHHHVLRSDALLMASDLVKTAQKFKPNSPGFRNTFAAHAALRSIQAAILISESGQVQLSAIADVAPQLTVPKPEQFAAANDGSAVLETVQNGNHIRALVKLRGFEDTYLYVARFVDARVIEHLRKTKEAVSEYESLEGSRVTVQVTFALIYIAVALVVLLAAIWLGLWAANRIVSPIGRLVGAAERVSEGDLSARVETGGSDDEIDMLGRAFNRMTGQLEAQRSDLVEANHQLDQRRQFTEAVLSGVSAGVLGLDAEGRVVHANRAALRFLDVAENQIVGLALASVQPKLAQVVTEARQNPRNFAQQHIILEQSGQERTLNVRATGELSDTDTRRYVLTFDDITELVRAQRTAAWADVARRIAHEIKNPLTPIQLSAERLRRKYGKEVGTDPEIFQQCTDTIIRQVEDIGRMVDEFSSFARMPTAVIARVNLVEIARQATFLQRVAHTSIDYKLNLPDHPIFIEADSRLVNQALTNILKNAAEAIAAAAAGPAEKTAGEKNSEKLGRIEVKLETGDKTVALVVTDSGCGLPANNRQRLTEPYVTTREKGTGLGLAIVGKVMEDHGGSLKIGDAPREEGWASGARIQLTFPYTAPKAERIVEANEGEDAAPVGAGGQREQAALKSQKKRQGAVNGV